MEDKLYGWFRLRGLALLNVHVFSIFCTAFVRTWRLIRLSAAIMRCEVIKVKLNSLVVKAPSSSQHTDLISIN